jgi:hypothetical protein
MIITMNMTINSEVALGTSDTEDEGLGNSKIENCIEPMTTQLGRPKSLDHVYCVGLF